MNLILKALRFAADCIEFTVSVWIFLLMFVLTSVATIEFFVFLWEVAQ